MITINTIIRITMLTAICILWTSAYTFAPFNATAQSQTAQSQLAQTNFDCTTVSEIPQIECEALVAIYNGTGGPNWVDNADWLQTTTPCIWHGVTCSNGHVTELDLDNDRSGNNLTGVLPTAIGDLGSLTLLSLAKNELTDIPAKLGDISTLAQLYVWENQLSSIPPEIGNLSNLTVFDLANNQLSSIPPEVGNLSNLIVFDLANNQLSSIPPEIGNLSNLTTLSLYENQLRSIPPEIGNLPNLTTLSLSANQLSSIPSEIGNLSNLEGLYLSANQLSSIPSEIGNLSNLKKLGLGDNGLSIIPPEIGNLTNLDGLYLVNNQLRSMPSGIGNLTNLINIYLRYNEFTSIPIELFELKQLSGLGLSGNQLTSIPPEIGNLTNLRELYLASNELTRISPEIDNLTNMLTLTVAYNRIVSADNNTLTAFLNQKDSDWLETQTVPPQNVAAEVLSPNSVKLSWTPIAFRDKGGYYEISVAKDGIYSIHNVTYNKDDNTYVVSGLVDDTNYTFRIRTYTPRHDGANTDPSVTKDDQLNELWSEYGDVITVRTLPKLEDDYEADNQCHIARLINPDSPPQPHTFHATADTDWVQFTAPTAGIYRIEATIPDGSRADVDLFYYSDCDAFHEDKFVETFAPGARIDVEAEAGQSFYIKVKHVDPMVYGPDVTYSLSVRRMLDETDDKGNVIIPGPAIVVAGRYSGADPAQGNIDETARYAYDLFTAKGRNESEIFFLATDSSLPGYDGEATKRNLEYGITQWAKEYLQKEHVSQVLTLYLVDHGGPDEFYLDRLNEEVLTANDLDTWLSELEDEFPDLLVNVIIEACRAGSFINRRNGSISSEGRVIITSSNQDYDAYVSRHGAAFSDEFISFLWTDHSLFYSFQASSHSVQQHHRYQRPWLDADGDGDPNEAEDFAIASLRSFANAGTLSSSWPPYIAGIDVSTTDASSQPQFHADVRHEYGNESIQEVWGVVYPPDYIQPTGEAAYEDDGELNAESLDIIEFTATDEAQYISDGSVDGKTVFTQMGVYRIVVYARDRDGLQARPVTVEVDTVALNGHRIFLPTVSR